MLAAPSILESAPKQIVCRANVTNTRCVIAIAASAYLVVGQNSEQPTAKVAKAQFLTCDNSISRHRAGGNGTDPALQIRERKFQSEDIGADLCLGAAIAGVNTLIGIDIGLIIVVCVGSASVLASVIRPTTAIFAPPRVDLASPAVLAALPWQSRYLHAGHLWLVGFGGWLFSYGGVAAPSEISAFNRECMGAPSRDCCFTTLGVLP
jgi:hypothetical protein